MATSELREYEQQLQAVDAAIAKDPGNEEWLRLRADLLEVIQLKQQLSEVKGEAAAAAAVAAAGEGAAAAASDLRSYAIGDKCQAVFEQDAQWYNAKVVALAEDGYFVTYLGYGNTAQVEFGEVRPYVRPDTSTWRAGTECMAIAPADGRWHEGRIVNVKPQVVTVRFHGESELAEVEIDCVRLHSAPPAKEPPPKQGVASSSGDGAASAAKEESGGPRLPKALEVRPDDSEEDAARKKRKLNMFKRQEKKEKEEKHGDDRRNSWQSFSRRNKTVQKTKNGHDPNWDPTRDHGETQARLAMDGRFGSRHERD